MKKEATIEICRSFSQKVSNPQNRYENMDFFASAKAEVGEADKEKVSEELYAFVKDEVSKSVYAYKLENIPVASPTETPAKKFAEAKANAPAEQAKQEVANEIQPDDTNFEDEAVTTLPTEEIQSPKDEPNFD